MGHIIKNIRYRVALQSTITILIAINCASFIILHILSFLLPGKGFSYDYLLSFASLSSNFHAIFSHPWTLITYMFAQTDIFHLLFNMIWLYWFGIFLSDRCSDKRILAIYLSGGLSGALFFIVATLFFGTGNYLVGSSASVFAIMTSTVLLMPDRTIDLMFLGSIKLKWIALIMIVLSFIGGSIGSNIAHLGGMAAGAAFAAPYLLPYRKRKSAPEHSAPADKSMDELLDKIRRSGYASLNQAERSRLNSISNEMRQKAHSK